ncbi:MAG: LacI family DNA-binding transcriptional regulator [Planctomycetota bacterium]|nr:LacI family DNA-binding transcriptional regulator [Planctomycetota bacterium]
MPRTKARRTAPTVQLPTVRFPGQLRSEQFRDHIVHLIQDMETGAKLPSERTLAKESGLSLLTVNKVLATIAAEGLVERRPGSGTYVKDRAPRAQAAPTMQILRFVVIRPESVLNPKLKGYTSHFYLGLREAAAEDGIEVLLTPYERGDGNVYCLPEDAFASSNVLGLIFVEDGVPDYRPLWRFLKEGRRVVAMDFASPEEGLSSVMYSDSDGLRIATEHLLKHGHRRIGYVGPGGSVGQPNELRMAGYRAAVQAAGLKPEDTPVILTGFKDTRELVRPWLERPADQRITGWVGFMDYYLLDVVKEAWALNLKVPEDVSVVGFGDALKTDPLTPIQVDSVAFNEIQMGRSAYDLWKTGAKGLVKRQPAELMVRGTVAQAQG